MKSNLSKIKYGLIEKEINIKFINDLYIIFLKLWINLNCLFFNKPTIKNIYINLNKIKILLDPKNGFIDRFIYAKKNWDETNTEIIKKNLKKKQCFIDVGSNIGYFSLIASNIVGKNGKVISIEPIKKLYLQNEINKEINSFNNIKIYNLGCSNKNEEKNIYKREDYLASSSTNKSYLSNYSFFKYSFFKKIFEKKKIKFKSEKIKLIKLDNIINHKVSFIKIDVEGHEYYSLLGMKKILKKYSPKLIIEINQYALRKDSIKKIFSYLKKLNYEIYFNYNLKKEINFKDIEKIIKAEVVDIFCINKKPKMGNN